MQNCFTSRRVRIAILALCCAGLVGGLGCVSMYSADGHRQRAHDFHNEPSLTDTIVAFGSPDAELVKRAGTNSVIALLGTNKTYVLVEGVEQLTNVAAKLAGADLRMGTFRSLYRKGDAVWGTITLMVPAGTNVAVQAGAMPRAGVFETAWMYAGTNAGPNPETLKRLEALGFELKLAGLNNPYHGSFEISPRYNGRTEYVYGLRIPVKGVIRPKVKLDGMKPTERTYSFALYNSPGTEPPADLGYWMVKMPLSFVADVALTPVYVVGLIVVGIAVAVN